MQRYRRGIVLVLIIIVSVCAVVILTGLFANYDDPVFQRALLRLLAVFGLVAVLTMFGTLLARTESIDQLASHPVPSRHHRTRR